MCEISSITVNVDITDPISELAAGCPAALRDTPVSFISTEEPMSRSGLNVVRNELRAYAALANHADPRSWIVKIDSDVLVTSSLKAFEHAHRSSGSMFGNPYKDCIQGGVYFLRVSEVQRMSFAPLSENKYVSSHRLCAEDAVINEQMRKGGGTIEQIQIASNRPTLKALNEETLNFSFLHFSNFAKADMSSAFDRLCKPTDELRGPDSGDLIF